jgi:hypothetical protein
MIPESVSDQSAYGSDNERPGLLVKPISPCAAVG